MNKRSPARRVGLYFMGCPLHSVPAQPHKTKPCSQEIRTREETGGKVEIDDEDYDIADGFMSALGC